jgi:hypothetical protein
VHHQPYIQPAQNCGQYLEQMSCTSVITTTMGARRIQQCAWSNRSTRRTASTPHAPATCASALKGYFPTRLMKRAVCCPTRLTPRRKRPRMMCMGYARGISTAATKRLHCVEWKRRMETIANPSTMSASAMCVSASRIWCPTRPTSPNACPAHPLHLPAPPHTFQHQQRWSSCYHRHQPLKHNQHLQLHRWVWYLGEHHWSWLKTQQYHPHSKQRPII